MGWFVYWLFNTVCLLCDMIGWLLVGVVYVGFVGFVRLVYLRLMVNAFFVSWGDVFCLLFLLMVFSFVCWIGLFGWIVFRCLFLCLL